MMKKSSTICRGLTITVKGSSKGIESTLRFIPQFSSPHFQHCLHSHSSFKPHEIQTYTLSIWNAGSPGSVWQLQLCTADDKQQRTEIIEQLCSELNAEHLKLIGNIAIIYRKAKSE